MKKSLFVLVTLITASLISFGQAKNNVADFQNTNRVSVSKTNQKINVDGKLDEPIWQQAQMATDFWNKYPTDQGHAPIKTEVRFYYDDNFLYIGATMYGVQEYIVQSLKRDQGIMSNDGLIITLDPFNQHTNGFLFSVNPYNAQADDLLTTGMEDYMNFSWDNKWFSQTVREKDRWFAEIAIPFKTLRYDQNNTTWGLNLIRSDKTRNEFYTWTNVPVNFKGFDLGFTGALVWDAAPPKPGSNISIVPYTTSSVSSNAKDNSATKLTADAGIDAKISLTTSLNLDLTINPNFSQVEVDRQVTNLSRFSIFFPERRSFFLENADLFSGYGIPPIRPFYSRKIGLDDNGNPVPIIAGLRLSGNLSPKTRIGVMNILTNKRDDQPMQNYSAVSVNQKVLARSAIKGYFFNRQSFMTDIQKTENPLNEFGRNGGVDFNYTSENGVWNAWHGTHFSMKPNINNNNFYVNGGGGYSGRKFDIIIHSDYVGENYYTDLGFVQRIENYDELRDTIFRKGFRDIFNNISYQIIPKKGKVNMHRLKMENYIVWNLDGSLNERSHEFGYNIIMKNSSRYEIEFSPQQTNLIFPTKFVDDDAAPPLPAGKYNYTTVRFKYSSDSRKNISFDAEVEYGKYFTADYTQYSFQLNLRQQPRVNVALQFEYNSLEFPAPYGSSQLFLIAPRFELNFSTSLFWTTFLQYNTQANNVNINSRLQWRYKPMSDLFLVYTDNYYSDPFMKNKNRALVFKMNYWLNL